MTRQDDRTAIDAVVELVREHGTDAIGQAFATMLEHAMRLERDAALEAAPYERTETRRGYANGYKQKTLRRQLVR